MIIRLVSLITIMVTVGLIATATKAAEWDTKHYHGSMCQPEDDEDDLYRWYTVGTRNKGEWKWTNLICPIVRDNTTNRDGVLVRVTVETEEGGWCSLHALSWPDPTSVLSAWGSWAGSGIRVIELQLKNSFRHGHYALWCTIEKGDSIISYWVAEKLPTNNDN